MPQLLIVGTVIGANNLAAALVLGMLGQKHRRWRIVPVFGVLGFAVPLIVLFAETFAGVVMLALAAATATGFI